VRIHRVAPGSRVRQTGWALPHATPADPAGPADSAGPTDSADAASPAGPVVALRSTDGPETLLAGLHGYETAAAVEAPDGTAFGSPALVPVLDGVALDGWAVAVAVLVGRDPQAGPTGAGAQAGPTGVGAAGLPTARADGGRVLVTWPDGTAHAFTTDGPVTA
jgi:hypothetical protein